MTSETRYFNKRFYTPRLFLEDLAYILRNLPGLLSSVRSRRIGRAFAEKIMLVVTQVNGCRYCSYGHIRMALRSGVTPEEIASLLAFEIDRFPTEQDVALAFAQHYAETEGRPDPRAEQRLTQHYGPKVSRDILNYIRMITLGNLSGNAADAFISRLQGKPARSSSLYNELFLFILFSPVILPLLWVMKRSKKATTSSGRPVSNPILPNQ